MPRLGFVGLAVFVMVVQSGCTMLHDLQPHRMWRWNRGPAPSSDPYFSVESPRRSSAVAVPNSVMNSATSTSPSAKLSTNARVELGDPVAELDEPRHTGR